MNQLNQYIKRWGLSDPQQLALTPTSSVYRVEHKNRLAVLKIFTSLGVGDESRTGALALKHFSGQGSVELIESDLGAHLISYADGESLMSVFLDCGDQMASEIICDVLMILHSTRSPLPEELPRLADLFGPLLNGAHIDPFDSLFDAATTVAERLLNTEQERVVLHGDIHHKNLIKCSRRGWLAIDPKGLVGECAYDFANVFYNPEDFPQVLKGKERTLELSAIFSKRSGIEQQRILEYALVFGCLSAYWACEDGLDPVPRLIQAQIVQSAL